MKIRKVNKYYIISNKKFKLYVLNVVSLRTNLINLFNLDKVKVDYIIRTVESTNYMILPNYLVS